MVSVLQQDWLATTSPSLAQRSFDRILVDAPCSNTGVIRRRIDVPWRLKPSDFSKLQDTQLNLLNRLSGHLAPHGRMVYSTCSLDHEENEAVVQGFLATHPEFELVSQSRVQPWVEGFDGAYSAALERRLH
jgi:16S rRNA (cytosine967-C5)-methyltransferase